jgi:DNA (cytosine-5)-methyltransferase 1
MQMLPEGWVTRVEHMKRNPALKLLGNGVVPPQAAYALRHLLEREAVAA